MRHLQLDKLFARNQAMSISFLQTQFAECAHELSGQELHLKQTSILCKLLNHFQMSVVEL